MPLSGWPSFPPSVQFYDGRDDLLAVRLFGHRYDAFPPRRAAPARVARHAAQPLGKHVLENRAHHHRVHSVSDVLATLDDGGAAGAQPVLALSAGGVVAAGAVPRVLVVRRLEEDAYAHGVVALHERLVEAVPAHERAQPAERRVHGHEIAPGAAVE